MTVKYYDDDAYATEFRATVLSCEKEENGYAVTLDGTLFFPEEGGQKSDTGMLDGVRVKDARLKDGIIYHITDAPVKVGSCVQGKIDFAERYHKMQNHTGEHIVSGIIHSLYGFENVGFHLGSEDVTLDFSGVLSREQLDHVEELANEAIYRNLPIFAEYPSADKLKEMQYRSKLDLSENVRIVTIEGVDACACCAPHVKTTGEVGVIKLLDFIRYKGGTRIHMQCGRAALLDYRKKYTEVAKCSALLSVKQAEISSGVSALIKANEELGFALKSAKKQMAELYAQTVLPFAPISYFIKTQMDADFWREVASLLSERHDSAFAFFYQRAKDSYAYILSAQSIDLKPLCLQINQSLGGKGGGKGNFYQGTCSANEEEIKSFFDNLTL